MKTKEPKYMAILRFADGSGADAKSNNLRRLKSHIRRGFAGETTDWGWTAKSPLEAWAIYAAGKIIEESDNYRN